MRGERNKVASLINLKHYLNHKKRTKDLNLGSFSTLGSQAGSCTIVWGGNDTKDSDFLCCKHIFVVNPVYENSEEHNIQLQRRILSSFYFDFQ